MKKFKVNISDVPEQYRSVVTEALQKKAFSLGYEWLYHGTRIHSYRIGDMYFHDNGTITFDLQDGLIDVLTPFTSVPFKEFMKYTTEDVLDTRYNTIEALLQTFQQYRDLSPYMQKLICTRYREHGTATLEALSKADTLPTVIMSAFTWARTEEGPEFWGTFHKSLLLED